MIRETCTRPSRSCCISGHLACPGCGRPCGMRIALKSLGENTVVVIPACCFGVLNGAYPFCALKVPVLNVAFETAGISAAGVRAALDMQKQTDVNVLAWAGDGGTFDIGLQSLSGAAERNDNIIYVCYDNEAYMNTGIQRSSATPYGAWTTTTPADSTEERTEEKHHGDPGCAQDSRMPRPHPSPIRMTFSGKCKRQGRFKVQGSSTCG